MDSSGPVFLIREAHPRDHRQLLALARELDSVNLPREPRELRDALARSAQSFRGRMRNRARAVYIFCAEEIATRRIVAGSMIIAKHGTPEAPHFYLEMDSDERYSFTLRKMFRHQFLRMRYSMDGPTELGGLIVTEAMRGHPERIGKQISWVRFLYIARHLARFEKQVLAEMLAPMTPEHGNRFWDHYGGIVTGLTFREADRLSTHDKEFIRALFPESPLYTFLMPEDVRASLGEVGAGSRGAVRLLEQAGMRFLSHLDPFDAGPYYGALAAELEPVKSMIRCGLNAGTPSIEKARNYLCAIEDKAGFRAVRADAESAGDNQLIVNMEVLKALGIKDKSHVDTVLLP